MFDDVLADGVEHHMRLQREPRTVEYDEVGWAVDDDAAERVAELVDVGDVGGDGVLTKHHIFGVFETRDVR